MNLLMSVLRWFAPAGAIAILLAGCATSIERLAIPSKKLKNDRYAQVGLQTSVDHTAWDAFLSKYTIRDDKGYVRVKYGLVNVQDQAALKRYIRALAGVNTADLSRDAQLAYWVNLYNAVTIDAVLGRYPVTSIREIKTRITDLGPWDEKRVNVNGEDLSLHDIEHNIVRPLWSDEPRVHYVLNCAAAGCPNLGQMAYTAANIQPALARAAREYINQPRGVHVDENGKLVVSKIFSWFVEDFGGSPQSVLAHLGKYADAETQAKLAGRKKIDAYRYDWALNDAAQR